MSLDRDNFINRLSEKLAAKIFWLDNSRLIYNLMEKTAIKLLIEDYDNGKDVSFIDDRNNKDLDFIAGWFSKEAQLGILSNHNIHPALNIMKFQDLVEKAQDRLNFYTVSEDFNNEIIVKTLNDGGCLTYFTDINAIERNLSRFDSDKDFLLSYENMMMQLIERNTINSWLVIRNKDHDNVAIFSFTESLNKNDGKSSMKCIFSTEKNGKPISEENWNIFFDFFDGNEKYVLSNNKATKCFPYVTDDEHKLHSVFNLPETLNIQQLTIEGEFKVDQNKEPVIVTTLKLPENLPTTKKIILSRVNTLNFPKKFSELKGIEVSNSHMEGMPDTLAFDAEFGEKSVPSEITFRNVSFGENKLQNISAYTVNLNLHNPEDMPTKINTQFLRVVNILANKPMVISAHKMDLYEYKPASENKDILHNIKVKEFSILEDGTEWNFPRGIVTDFLNIQGTRTRNPLTFNGRDIFVSEGVMLRTDDHLDVDFNGLNISNNTSVLWNSKLYRIRTLKLKKKIKSLLSFNFS